MSRIFISYRRDDSHDAALLIHSELAKVFGAADVFIDVDGIEPGMDFVEALHTNMTGCQVMLVVIADTWATVTTKTGRRRLDIAHDFVRLEVEAGLSRAGVQVIPILLNDAEMPDVDELPASLHPLVRKQGVHLNTRQSKAGLLRLTDVLRRSFEKAGQGLGLAGPVTEQRAPTTGDSGLVSRPATSNPNSAVQIQAEYPTLWWPEGLASGERDAIGPYVDLPIKDQVQRFRWIAPGSFMMGSDLAEQQRFANGDKQRLDWMEGESPRHTVTIGRGFWIADTPCTVGFWRAWTGLEGAHHAPDGAENIDQHPVVEVSWDDVQGQLPGLRRGFKKSRWIACLPTEAQWEYACRAGSTQAFWFGPTWLDQFGNIGRKGDKYDFDNHTTEVDHYPPNRWGLHDMHGNVWEWCEGYSRTYSAEAQTDPPDAHDPEVRALRGGSWGYPVLFARSTFRRDVPRAFGSDYLGFRLVLRSIIEP